MIEDPIVKGSNAFDYLRLLKNEDRDGKYVGTGTLEGLRDKGQK